MRFGPWAEDQEKHTDLAIAFYKRGKLIKKYEVRELIQNPDQLEDSTSHYTWRPATQTEPNGFYGQTFHLVLIDMTAYSFDYETGEIITQKRDEGAKSRRKIQAEERALASKRGEELLKASHFKEPFESHFEISHAQAMQDSFSGCSLKGATWVAELTPKRELDHKASVHPVFPIQGENHVEVSLTPQEIIFALEKAFVHPFVKQRFDEGEATGIRLRIQGDRLHWNTPELIDFIEKITRKRETDDNLAHWAYLILDAENPRYTSIYLNTKTGEVIATDKSKWPWEPHLIDATGKRTNANNRMQATFVASVPDP